MPPSIDKFPDYFRAYAWNDKHALFGYPADAYTRFAWINSLEGRFTWLRGNCAGQRTASLHLIRELIQWGGAQNGVLQKFDDGIGEVNLQALLASTIANLGAPGSAIKAALAVPGMGLTYASKLLRFLEPNHYGALDSRIRTAIQKHAPDADLRRIHDGNLNSTIAGYERFIRYLTTLQCQLQSQNIARPTCDLEAAAHGKGWRLADVEMALFAWAAENH